MSEKLLRDIENSAFDRLCNLVDAYTQKDIPTIFRKLKEAKKWMDAKKIKKG